jgi:threonylcarbamoyladenosine tRNA methylthiotransferase MtaB
MDPVKIQLHSFGCKVNSYDLGIMQKKLIASGRTIDLGHKISSEPLVHVLNTCAVTAEATKEAVKLTRKIKAKSPFSKVVITGCAAQVDTEVFDVLPGVDLIVANSHKGFLPEILEQLYKGNIENRIFKSNIFKKEDLEAEGGTEAHHTRSYLKIQDGCNSFCTYCVIPYARGKSRSISIQALVEKVKQLETQGFKEIVLTGVHIGDYEDIVSGKTFVLEDLLETILLKTQIPRIRLTSLEPPEITDRLLSLYKNQRMCPHFHMSIQSASDKVLNDMKRQYNTEDVRQALERIQNSVPGAFVGMDVIVGFPTETEEDFLSTYKVLAEAPWTRIHVFPYSERKGTPAARLIATVPMSERSERSRRLRELSSQKYLESAANQLGKVKQVLVQKNLSKGGHGLSNDYWNVKIMDIEPGIFENQIVSVRIDHVGEGTFMDAPLVGSLVQ